MLAQWLMGRSPATFIFGSQKLVGSHPPAAATVMKSGPSYGSSDCARAGLSGHGNAAVRPAAAITFKNRLRSSVVIVGTPIQNCPHIGAPKPAPSGRSLLASSQLTTHR